MREHEREHALRVVCAADLSLDSGGIQERSGLLGRERRTEHEERNQESARVRTNVGIFRNKRIGSIRSSCD